MDSPFTIREYRPEDEAQLRDMIVTFQNTPAIFDASFEKSGEEAQPFMFSRLMKQIEGGGTVVVAESSEQKGSLLGFGAGEVQNDEENTKTFFYVSDTFVKPEWQGKGIGGLMLENLERSAKERGIHFLSIAVLSRNVDAERLYKRFGFEEYKHTLMKRLA